MLWVRASDAVKIGVTHLYPSADESTSLAAADAFEITRALAFDPMNSSSLIASLRFARDNARQVREQISTEMWNQLNRLYLRLAPIHLPSIWNDQPAHIFQETVDELLMLDGMPRRPVGSCRYRHRLQT